MREEETFNPLKFSEKLKDVKNTKRADMISQLDDKQCNEWWTQHTCLDDISSGLRDKFEHQNSWGEVGQDP